MFEHILLEPEQKELLEYLVETIRSFPRDQRNKFLVIQSMEGQSLIYPGHPNLNRTIFIGDIEVLAQEDLVTTSNVLRDTSNVNVVPKGFAYYDFMKRQAGQPTANVEEAIRTHLDSAYFRQKYPQAYQKWAEAEEMLWSSDSDSQGTMIGHLCREAFQAFATVLVEQYNPQIIDEDKTHTVKRIKAVLDNQSNKFGATERHFLEALLVYLGTVSDLVQRQEHGAQKEGELLNWEDARRVVFQVAVVMFEIDKAIT